MHKELKMLMRNISVFIAAALLMTGLTHTSAQSKDVFSSTLAGRWYTADSNELKKEVRQLFEVKTDVKPAKDIIALILPHAGYQYSGRTAAMGIKSLGRQYKRIIIIGPSHYAAMADTLSIPKETVYKTPLGEVDIDTDFVKKLLGYPQFQIVDAANKNEHSTQIEVPLLQFAHKDFKIVLIVAGRLSQEAILQAASILNSLIDKDTLVIASSDFVHYGPNYGYVPFTEDISEQLKKIDMGAYKYIEQLDSSAFLQYVNETGATICGEIPIAILLSMVDKSTKVHLINYTTSGQITGDFTNSVSYLAVSFCGQWLPSAKPAEPQPTTPKDESGLTQEDKKILLELARKSIVHFLDNHQLPDIPDENLSSRLKVSRAAFVTLNVNHQLRGCIGDIFPRQPLYKSVIANAVNAAVNDRRFYPVSSNELKDITIEISALTVPKSIDSYEQIRVGTDGVVLQKDGYSAVFLPQVAPEQKWDREQMLEHLSRKAGLPADAWKQGASFLTFQADVFGESE